MNNKSKPKTKTIINLSDYKKQKQKGKEDKIVQEIIAKSKRLDW